MLSIQLPTTPACSACSKNSSSWRQAIRYARTVLARSVAFTDWLHTYNHHRGHSALKGQSPADLVPNLRTQNT